MAKDKTPRVLILDIETLPMLVYTWGLWDQNIPVEGIKKDGSIICISYMWQGEEDVHTVSIGDHPAAFKKNPRNDKYVVREFAKLYNEADAIITQNGKSFDVKWINYRLSCNGLAPLPKVPHFDLKLLVKQAFRVPSTKLSYLSRKVNKEKKGKMEFEDWVKIDNGNLEALTKMTTYCPQDIRATRDVFEEMKAFFPAVLNLSAFRGELCCPSCGSHHIIKQGTRMSGLQTYIRLQCKACNHWFQGSMNKKGELTNLRS